MSMWSNISDKKSGILLLLVILSRLCLSTTGMAETSKEERYLEIKKVENNNNDGHFLKAVVWDKMEEQVGFFSVPTNQPATEQTTFKIAHDNEYIYLRIVCIQKHARDHVATYPAGSKHDSPVFCDDSLEIYFDTLHDHEAYYYFVCNMEGVTYDAKYAGVNANLSWNGRWFLQTTILEDKWIADISIPFSTLFIRPQKGDIWGFNIARTNKACGFSSWSPGLDRFHIPRKFGHLIWGPFSNK
jgi:hypothetical protein